jgi:hypothetical protein
MIWTQALHWLAFLVAMNIVLLANVQLTLTATATGLTLLMLLALGTFVAGVLCLGKSVFSASLWGSSCRPLRG